MLLPFLLSPLFVCLSHSSLPISSFSTVRPPHTSASSFSYFTVNGDEEPTYSNALAVFLKNLLDILRSLIVPKKSIEEDCSLPKKTEIVFPLCFFYVALSTAPEVLRKHILFEDLITCVSHPFSVSESVARTLVSLNAPFALPQLLKMHLGSDPVEEDFISLLLPSVSSSLGAVSLSTVGGGLASPFSSLFQDELFRNGSGEDHDLELDEEAKAGENG